MYSRIKVIVKAFDSELAMLITSTLKNKIERIIAKIERDYQNTQGLILTEDDLKCLIYGRLKSYFQPVFRTSRRQLISNSINNNKLAWRMLTSDQHIYASPVHTEIPWYDDNHRLVIRPDITILEPNNLSILHGLHELRLPSKQCEFGGQGIILELKFIRSRTGLGSSNVEDIRKDFNKIRRLYNRFDEQGRSQDLFCYFVIFNKTDIVCNEFRQFIQENEIGPRHKMIYATGKVSFAEEGSTISP